MGSRAPVVEPQTIDVFAETDSEPIDGASNTRDGESTIGHQGNFQMSRAAPAPPATTIATSATASTVVVDAATFPKCRFCFKYQRVCDGGSPCGTCIKMKRSCYQVPQQLLDQKLELAKNELLKAEQKSASTGNGTNDTGASTKCSGAPTKRFPTKRSPTKRAATSASHAMERPKKKRKIEENILALNLARYVARKVQKRQDAAGTTDALPILAVFKRKQAAELKHCYRAINELLSDKHSDCNRYFLDPVDHVAMNLPHYRSIVEFPMDLSTMKENLEDGHYRVAREFKKDFKKIAAAARLFNEVGSDVFKAANKLEEVFEVVWAETKHIKMELENEQPSTQN